MTANNNKMNIGFFYNRLYFEELQKIKEETGETATKKLREKTEKVNEIITNLTDKSIDIDQLIAPINNPNTFKLTTTYPGLFTGAGMPHEQGITGELKLGFYFDYTTGMPVIPGSTVKGMLRSAFPQWDNHVNTKENIKWAKTTYILEALNLKEEKEKEQQATMDKITRIEREIFDGLVNDNYLSIYERDIFLDAYITQGGKGGHIFGSDAITPHVHDGKSYQESMLLDPIPITFLKILPNVSFKFNFVLKDHKDMDDKLLNVEEKTLLFKTILEDFGIGAKTNVGYGQLIDSSK